MLVAVLVTGVEAARAGPRACSLVTAAQARSIVGYPVQVRKGETAADCVVVASPIRIDSETLSPLHPTINFTVVAGAARQRPFSVELAEARKRGFGPAPGLGSNSYLVPGPQPGALGIYTRIRGTVLEIGVGPAKKPVTRARALRFARFIAGKL